MDQDPTSGEGGRGWGGGGGGGVMPKATLIDLHSMRRFMATL